MTSVAPTRIETQLGWNFLNRICSKYWSSAFSRGDGHGLSIHHKSIDEYPDLYLRIGELTQRELKKEFLKRFLAILQKLEDIFLIRKYSNCFYKWKEYFLQKYSVPYVIIPSTKNSNYHQLKYLFHLWKEKVILYKLDNQYKRHGLILLYFYFMKMNLQKLNQSFQIWFQYIQWRKKLLRKIFDSWSLWVLQSKLHQANVLRFCKIFLSNNKKRIPRTIRSYFERWKYHSDLIEEYRIMKYFLSLWKRYINHRYHLSQIIRKRCDHLLLQHSYLLWKKLFRFRQIAKLLFSSLSEYLLQYYYARWFDYLQARKLLKNWILTHLANVALQPLPSVEAKPIHLEVEDIIPCETPQPLPTECIAKSTKRHATCRCVRCLSRYGHLGARTRESYLLSNSGDSPLRHRYGTPLHTPLSKSRTSSHFETHLVDSETSRSFLETSVPQEYNPPAVSFVEPPIVVIESSCTVTDHLKYRIQSISQLTKDYENKKSQIKKAKGKKIIITPKKRIGY